MGHVLIKPVPSRDEYVYWSTIVEAPFACGDRAETLKELAAEKDSADPPGVRLARADATGTSAKDGYGRWGWDAFVYEQRGILARKDMYYATLLLCDGREAEMWDLLTPFEDETEVRRG